MVIREKHPATRGDAGCPPICGPVIKSAIRGLDKVGDFSVGCAAFSTDGIEVDIVVDVALVCERIFDLQFTMRGKYPQVSMTASQLTLAS